MLSPLRFEAEVRERLKGRPHLKPIFSDVHDIARRLREEVDDTLFIVWNSLRQRYEVHCLEHWPDTYAWAVPFDRLDARVVRLAKRNNLRVRGRDIFREVDEHNRKLEESALRQFRNDVVAAAIESRGLLARYAWEVL